MPTEHDLSLSPRKKDIREAKPFEPPVQFALQEIRQHFSEGMNAVRDQYDVAELLASTGKTTQCQTIWRSQIVIVESLLDFYIHEVSKYCLFRMFTGQWTKSEKYASLLVPMEKVEEALATAESKDWFFNYLNERFSRDVFLSRESMQEQLNLIGIGYTQVMVKAFPDKSEEASRKYGSQVVAELFKRRNTIAHQYDRNHASAEQEDISKDFVIDYVAKVEAIVKAIHQIIEDKESAA